jgi:hypothetical protein
VSIIRSLPPLHVSFIEKRLEETELIGCSETTKSLCPTYSTLLYTNPTMNCRENLSLLMKTALFWVTT